MWKILDADQYPLSNGDDDVHANDHDVNDGCDGDDDHDKSL